MLDEEAGIIDVEIIDVEKEDKNDTKKRFLLTEQKKENGSLKKDE